MKKFSILALAALLVVAFTIPAAALENEFGGYWRTRMYSSGNWDGESGNDETFRRVDTRTRLYYTAKINDNLKLVNKFEMDAQWGGDGYSRNNASAGGNNRSYGQVAADGANIEIKNSYADFNTGPVNWTVGVQPYVLFRSFYIDEDASGVIARWKILDNFVLAGSWLKAYEGGKGSGNNEDADSYTVTGAFWFSENISLKPSVSWTTTSDADGYFGNTGDIFQEADIVTYGFDFDASWDAFGIWATAFMQDGTLDSNLMGDVDFEGWLVAVGGNVMLGPVDLHGQFIYTPGQDSSDNDYETVFAPYASYYWAEIMGLGIFDDDAPGAAPGDKITDLMAFGIGTTFTPMDKLKIAVDLWYAELEEDDEFGENELGTELDVVVTYQLVEGLNLDLVGAYLWAGDAMSVDGNNNEDPYEIGARLSLSF